MTLNWTHVVTLLSMTVLVGTEVMAVALATAWAIGGMLELGHAVTLGLMALFGAGGVYVIAKFVLQALKVEPLRG